MSEKHLASALPESGSREAVAGQSGYFPWILLLAATVLGLFIYSIALDGTLLFDTKVALSHNPLVQLSGDTFDDWRTAMLSFQGSAFGRPLSQLSFALNYVIAGEFSVVQLRLTNLAIHFAVACLVYGFLWRFLSGAPVFDMGLEQARRLAALAAVLWFLHPIHVSTVFYVVQRMAQLSTLFVILGLYVYVRYRNTWMVVAPTPGAFLAGAGWLGLVVAAGLLFKENAALLVWLIPVLEVCGYRGRWGGKDNLYLRWLAYAALSAPVVVVTVMVTLGQFDWLGGYVIREFSLAERSLTQLRVLWHYVGWIILPNAQVLSLHHDDIVISSSLLQPFSTLLAAAAWMLSGILVFVLRRRAPLLPFVWLFYLVSHSMESSILPLEMVWEHRNYLPSVAVCLAIAAAFGALRARISTALASIVLGIFILMLSVNLFLRTDRWSDELLLARINVENHPDSLRSNYHYANTLYRVYVDNEDISAEYLVASRHHYERMHQLDRKDVSALISLYFLDQLYFPQLAEQVDWFSLLEEAVETRVFSASDFNALELLLTCLGDGGCKMDRARVFSLFDAILARYPENAQVWLLLGRYQLEVMADDSKALEAYRQALNVHPAYLNTYLALVQLYDRRGDPGSVYHWLTKFMGADVQRRELRRVKQMLEPAGSN